MPFEIVNQETIYHGRVFDVCIDHVRLPNGRIQQLDVVKHRPAVTMLPLDTNGDIWFIRQYRHPIERMLLELPAGVLEEGEDAESGARREIREEIGMAAGKLVKLGEFFLAPGYSTEYMYVYLATDLHPAPLQADEDEFIQVEKIPSAQVMHLAMTGQINDSKSLVALFLAQLYFSGSLVK